MRYSYLRALPEKVAEAREGGNVTDGDTDMDVKDGDTVSPSLTESVAPALTVSPSSVTVSPSVTSPPPSLDDGDTVARPLMVLALTSIDKGGRQQVKMFLIRV